MSTIYNSTIQRRTPLLRSQKSMKKVGKKGKLRERINGPNRIRFAAMGLLGTCEAKLLGCWPNGRLTWMHGKKDRLLTMHERKFLVIRACTVCHNRIELSGHENMLKFVLGVIEKRNENLRRLNGQDIRATDSLELREA